MSLANTLAVGQAGASLVLLGDPRQLDQPIQGVHPPGADVSALGHLVGESPRPVAPAAAGGRDLRGRGARLHRPPRRWLTGEQRGQLSESDTGPQDRIGPGGAAGVAHKSADRLLRLRCAFR